MCHQWLTGIRDMSLYPRTTRTLEPQGHICRFTSKRVKAHLHRMKWTELNWTAVTRWSVYLPSFFTKNAKWNIHMQLIHLFFCCFWSFCVKSYSSRFVILSSLFRVIYWYILASLRWRNFHFHIVLKLEIIANLSIGQLCIVCENGKWMFIL